MPSKYFLDTSYAIALVSPKDEFHQRAVKFSLEIEDNGAELVTTRPVLLEIGNSLAHRAVRESGLALINAITSDKNIEIIELTAALYNKAVELFSQRMDKEWGLVDCVSFIVMEKSLIDTSLTADKHFTQAGFRALLREDNI